MCFGVNYIPGVINPYGELDRQMYQECRSRCKKLGIEKIAPLILINIWSGYLHLISNTKKSRAFYSFRLLIPKMDKCTVKTSLGLHRICEKVITKLPTQTRFLQLECLEEGGEQMENSMDIDAKESHVSIYESDSSTIAHLGEGAIYMFPNHIADLFSLLQGPNSSDLRNIVYIYSSEQ